MVSWAVVLLSVALSTLASADDIDKQFEKFVDEFKREYDAVEKEVRREVFRSNIRYIEEENAKGHSYVLGVTEFTDMTADEFELTHFGLANSKPWGNLQSLGTHVPRNTTLPASVDWRSAGAVTPVKNQASCGSCWAFSTTGSLEGAWQIASGKLVSLSEQQLVDCSKSFGNEGCNGGLMDNGFKYAEQTAMCAESSYPYLARNSICKASSCTSAIPKGSVTGFKDVKADDTNALMDAVAQQPVSIAIEADKTVFQLYKGGVLSGDCGSNLDHGVLVVGYGSENGQDYWVVKNSWGSSWGMKGYALLLRGKKGAGECGIKSQASYPVVAGAPGPSPGPSPSPPPPPPSSSHYEKPPCQEDETEASVQGAGGEVCAPSCDTASCPTDTPPGTRAKPQCILQDASTGKKYCALACLFPGSCPKGSKCARISGIQGLCVWPASAKSHPTKTLELRSPHTEISI